MTDCERIRELIPWYVEGSLDPEETGAVACHVAACDACLREIASALQLRTDVRGALEDALPRTSPDVWRRVRDRTQGRPIAQIDVGSFFLGFRLGASAARGTLPLRGDLRLLGRNIRLFDRRKGGER